MAGVPSLGGTAPPPTSHHVLLTANKTLSSGRDSIRQKKVKGEETRCDSRNLCNASGKDSVEGESDE